MLAQGDDCARLVLASSSPRRRLLLAQRQLRAHVVDPGVDDGELCPGNVRPRDWAAALAHLKAKSGAAAALASGLTGPATLLLSADTVVDKDGQIIGQPIDADDARRIIKLLRNGRHRVVTAAVLVRTGGEDWVVDEVEVEVGDISDDAIETYIASGAWRGKAGAYNLQERIEAGWPLRPMGDPTTVMGLPMERLMPLIHKRLAHAPWFG